ncbi:MAG TPA: VOC family protein [Ktedonobacterales bacterium]|jgi:hypothetical protein|nr:VOC family protein [Ktedonobacterales bacterium]
MEAPALDLAQAIYGMRDPDAAIQRIQALGLTVLDAGRHRGLSTAKRVIALGSAYTANLPFHIMEGRLGLHRVVLGPDTGLLALLGKRYFQAASSPRW